MNASKFACVAYHQTKSDHFPSISTTNDTQDLVDEICGFSDNESQPKKSRHNSQRRKHKHHSSVHRSSRSHHSSSSRKKRISSSEKHVLARKHSHRSSKKSVVKTAPKYVVKTLYGDEDQLPEFSLETLDRYGLVTLIKEEKKEENVNMNQIKTKTTKDANLSQEIKSSPTLKKNSQEVIEYEYYKYCPDSSQHLKRLETNEKQTKDFNLAQSQEIKSSPLFNISQEESQSEMMKEEPNTSSCSRMNVAKFQVSSPKNSKVKVMPTKPINSLSQYLSRFSIPQSR